jgi:hypothetical protein
MLARAQPMIWLGRVGLTLLFFVEGRARPHGWVGLTCVYFVGWGPFMLRLKNVCARPMTRLGWVELTRVFSSG